MSSLFDTMPYDKWPAIEDLAAVADRIAAFVSRGKVSLELTEERLTRQLATYVTMRRSHHWSEISLPQHERTVPAGWTAANERIWVDWIHHVFEFSDWQQAVMRPVFGTDERQWEIGAEGWRDEVFTFLPTWIARSTARFAEIDPTPLPDPEPEDTDPRNAKIDPYLLEHGRRGRRIKGVRTFDQ